MLPRRGLGPIMHRRVNGNICHGSICIHEMDDGRQPSQKKSESVAAAAVAAVAATQRFQKRSSDLNGKRKREKCEKFL